MKRYLITIIVVLTAFVLAWPVLGQREDRGGRQGQQDRAGQGGGQGLSEEERAKLRERMQNMSEEERQQLRTQMRERFGAGGPTQRMSSEEQLKAIQAIEEQLAKLKAAAQAQPSRPSQSLQDLPEEERTKLMEERRKIRQEQQAAFKTIITQIAMLQGQRQPAAEGEEFIIINTGQLKAVQELAVKEKAKETADRLTSLLQPFQRGGRSRQPSQQDQPGQGQPGRQPGERGNRQRQQGPASQGGDV